MIGFSYILYINIYNIGFRGMANAHTFHDFGKSKSKCWFNNNMHRAYLYLCVHFAFNFPLSILFMVSLLLTRSGFLIYLHGNGKKKTYLPADMPYEFIFRICRAHIHIFRYETHKFYFERAIEEIRKPTHSHIVDVCFYTHTHTVHT